MDSAAGLPSAHSRGRLSSQTASLAVPHFASVAIPRYRVGAFSVRILTSEDEEFCTHDAVVGRERGVSR